MPTGPITKSSVDALKCPEHLDRIILWDGGHREAVRGFGVIAYRNGGKVYVAQSRRAGKSPRTRIAEHGRVTPEEARKEARKVLGGMERGEDPIAERRAARAVRTFKAVGDDFLQLHVRTKRKSRTGDEYERLLAIYIFPEFGSKRIVDLKLDDVAKLHGKLSASPYQANRAIAIISAVWNWAAKRGEASFAHNPVRLIERYPEKGRERYLTTEELGRLGDVLRQGEDDGLAKDFYETGASAKRPRKAQNRRTKLDPFAAAAIRLLVLTGARLREILHARWQEVDLERGALFLSDSKTGQKTIYLSAAAKAVLAGMPRMTDNPYIVAGVKDGEPRSDLNRPWRAIRAAAKLEGLRIHDLRHSFASVGAGASFGLPIIGKLLGHSQAATTHRYAHLDADPLRRAVDTIGATISAAMERGDPDNVHSLSRRNLKS